MIRIIFVVKLMPRSDLPGITIIHNYPPLSAILHHYPDIQLSRKMRTLYCFHFYFVEVTIACYHLNYLECCFYFPFMLLTWSVMLHWQLSLSPRQLYHAVQSNDTVVNRNQRKYQVTWSRMYGVELLNIVQCWTGYKLCLCGEKIFSSQPCF